MIASGRASPTAALTAASSSTSSTAGSAPSDLSCPARAADREVPVTWWPRSASWGMRRRPIAPLAPTTRTRMTPFRPFMPPACRHSGPDRCVTVTDTGAGGNVTSVRDDVNPFHPDDADDDADAPGPGGQGRESETAWLAERFEEHRGRLRAVAYRMLGSLDEADDAVQEACVRFSAARTDGVVNLGGWLTTIVSRVCLNTLRARASRPET